MALVVLATLLILAIAYFQTTQGFFSSVILAFLSVLSAGLALNFYEPVAASILYESSPLYAEAIVLVLMFSLPLIGVRFVVDKYVPNNVVLGMWTDRIGSAVFGVIVGMVGIGILTVAMQMLPFRESVLTYRPFDDQLQRTQHLGPFRPDDFVLGLGRTLSGGGLAGERKFGDVHDQLLLKLFCDRNGADMNGRFDAEPGDLAILGIYEPKAEGPSSQFAAWLRRAPANPLLSEEENQRSRVIVVRVTVNRKAADPSEESREDNRKTGSYWRLPATQFRLAWHDGRNFYPVGYLTSPNSQHAKRMKDENEFMRDQWYMWIPPKDDDGNLAYTKLAILRPTVDGKAKRDKLVVDWVFRLPADVRRPAAPAEPEAAEETGEGETVEETGDLREAYLAFRRVAEVPFDLTTVQATHPPKGEKFEDAPMSHAMYPARKD
jgi:hypothetical protein